MHLTPAEILEQWGKLCNLAHNRNASQYFGVCPRPAPGQDRAKHIRIVRVLWADIDCCTPEVSVTRCRVAGLPGPSIVVNSGHGVHLYWLLAEPFIVEDAFSALKVESVLRGIYSVIGADHTHDRSRILRLPGSWNRKRPQRHRAKALQN